MQNTIFFSLRRGLSSEEQSKFLDYVRRWDRIDSVGRLDPNGTVTYFLYTTPGANAERVASRLRKDEHVDTASVQPDRYAVAI